MRVGIYSPYLDTVGGGERYMLTIAEALSKNHQVDVFLDTHLQTIDLNKITEKVKSLLDLDLSKVKFINAPFGKGSSGFSRLVFLKKYDLLFYLTDGSIFFSTAKKNILHIQSPIKISGNSVKRKIKQSSWDLIIYNSEFTKKSCEKYWKIPGQVIYPPVNIENFKAAKSKKKQIVSVGRFFGYLKDKKHELMIDVFKQMVDSKQMSDWSLHLAGGAQAGDQEYVEDLKKLAKGYPIHVHPNLPFSELKELYAQSLVYWHAAGFNETNPEKMEHFGITTVEAMAAGCVPVVINLGGQREIIRNGENGFLWDNPTELRDVTLKLVKNPEEMKKLSSSAVKSVDKFSKHRFTQQIEGLLN